MSQIEVEKIIEPVAASDGAGVKLKRSSGTHLIDYHDPFLMLDEFGSENKDDYIGGFPPHPHRGIETVTYMLAGDFEHKDSTGGEGIMTAGDVQWMKTGSGIIHSEMPAMKEGKEFYYNLPSTHKSLIYLIDGEIKVGDKNHDQAKNSTLIILSRGEKLKVSSLTKVKFLLISGKPIGEPIARGGPFVMNTKAEILQAVQDYHNGTFVK